jgi:CRP/FNR family cyclic AMP-dependent transcriptional regulator
VTEELTRRFEGAAGRRRLVELLLRQAVVSNEEPIALALADSLNLVAHRPGELLVAQAGTDTDIFFIVVGDVAVEINGREVARRSHGQHVGEMTLIDPSQRRSASVRAVVETLSGRVSEEAFAALAAIYPAMWRRLALEVSQRLRERASHVRPRNERPEVFIGSCSSAEGLELARALQTAHCHDPWTTRVWTDGTFRAGTTPIEALVAQLATLDFALLVVTPDDLVVTSERGVPSPRDNVIFELGLMMGALGRERTFMVKNRCRAEDLHLPSDLVGVQALEVSPGDASTIQARVGPVANEFRQTVKRLWSR